MAERPKSKAGDEVGAARERRRFASAIGQSLRELAIQLSLLNHQIGATSISEMSTSIASISSTARGR